MFELNGVYRNRIGEYTVLALNGPRMTVRYADGSEAELNVNIQARIWENIVAEQEARAAGYRLLLSSMDLNVQYGEDIFKDLSGRRIDALILMGLLVDQSPKAQATLTHSLSRNLPIVEVNDRANTDAKVDSVISDYRAATTEAMAHLFSLGHRRIGLVYGVAIADLALDRLEPYQEALMSMGLAVDPELIIDRPGLLEPWPEDTLSKLLAGMTAIRAVTPPRHP